MWSRAVSEVLIIIGSVLFLGFAVVMAYKQTCKRL